MPRGRPRKLREGETVEGTTATIASENWEGSGNTSHVSGETIVSQATVTASESTESYSYLLPYQGRNTLREGEPRYFVNGRKLIQVIKDRVGSDDQGNAVYVIRRKLAAVISDKRPQGRELRQLLKRKDIPGA